MPFSGFKKTIFLSFFVSALFSPALVCAADSHELPQLVVSATRFEQSTVTTPASIQIISRQEIEKTQSQNLTQLLQGRGGVAIYDLFGNGTNTTVGLRGFSESASANTLIMIDGRRLNNADTGAPKLNSISLKNIERVEIIQGGAGVLYGDQAVGGVINIITRRPDKNQASLGFGVGSYEAYKSFFSVDRELSRGLSLRLHGEARDAQNYRDHGDLEFSDLAGELHYQYDNGQLFAEVSRMRESQDFPGNLTQAQLIANRRQAKNFTDFGTQVILAQRIGIEHDLDDHWTFAGELTNRENNNPYYLFGGNGYQARQLVSFNPRLLGSYPLNEGELTITTGIDYEITGFLLRSAWVNRSNEQDTLGYYIQTQIPLSGALSVTAGARHARQKNDLVDATTYPAGQKFNDDITVGELGVSYRPSESQRLFARVEQNFRFPKVDEQGYTSAGNVLTTQSGVSWEAGFEQALAGGWLSANLYRLDLEDEIAFDASATDPFGGNTGANVNFDPTRHQGIILQGGYQLNADWGLNASYSYTDARFRSGAFAGKRISFIAAHTARIAADWQVNEDTDFMLEWLYTGDRYRSGDNANVQAKVDAHTVINLSANYQFNHYRLGLRVNNLTSEKYNAYENSFGSKYPAAERNFMLEASVEL